jgi:hypothetical protein
MAAGTTGQIFLNIFHAILHAALRGDNERYPIAPGLVAQNGNLFVGVFS